MIEKYTELLKQINNYMIVNEWDFSQAADYMMLNKKERQHCINILDLMVAGDKEAIKTYFG